MKPLILTALLSAALISRSQEILFTDSAKIPHIVSAIVSEIPAYHFVRIDTSKGKKAFTYIYSDSIHALKIGFLIWEMGGNKDLELPDTVYYKLASIIGPYKALFPYWKRYFQPDADLIEVQSAGHGKLAFRPYIGKKEFVCAFNKSGNGWWIIFNRY